VTPRARSRRIGAAQVAGAWCFGVGIAGLAVAVIGLLAGAGFLAFGALACVAGVLLLASDVLTTAALNAHLNGRPHLWPVEPHDERV